MNFSLFPSQENFHRYSRLMKKYKVGENDIFCRKCVPFDELPCAKDIFKDAREKIKAKEPVLLAPLKEMDEGNSQSCDARKEDHKALNVEASKFQLPPKHYQLQYYQYCDPYGNIILLLRSPFDGNFYPVLF